MLEHGARSLTVRTSLLLFGIASLVKVAMLAVMIGHPAAASPYGILAGVVGDSGSYLTPIDSLLAQGTYDPDYRMPGYGAAYLVFRLFLPQAHAGDTLVIAQTLFDALGTLLLALIALRMTGQRWVFHTVFWVALLGHTVTRYDALMLTESFTTNAIIASAYLILPGNMATPQRWRVLLSGMLCAWALFMRPALLPVLPLVALWYSIRPGVGLRAVLTRASLYCLPFIAVETAWVARNFAVHHRFVPAHQSVHYASIDDGILGPMLHYVEAFGGRTSWWDPDAEIRFFGIDGGFKSPVTPALPADVVVPGCSMDDLRTLADDVRHLRNDTMSADQRTAATASIRGRFIAFRQAYIAEHPWRYRLLAPLRLTGHFLFHSGTENALPAPWAELPLWQRALKLAWALLFIVVETTGILACAMALVLPRLRRTYFVPAACTLALLLMHPVVFRATEYRYIVPFYPWLILMAAVVASSAVSRDRAEQTSGAR